MTHFGMCYLGQQMQHPRQERGWFTWGDTEHRRFINKCHHAPDVFLKHKTYISNGNLIEDHSHERPVCFQDPVRGHLFHPARWLERRTHDWKVAGLNPCRSGGRMFCSRVDFLCWLLFRYPLHPRVTAVARKRPRSFCQTCRWQVPAKYACTFRMWLCIKWHGACLYCVHRTRRDGSSFMWHQPYQPCKYTTSVDIQKRAIKSYSPT